MSWYEKYDDTFSPESRAKPRTTYSIGYSGMLLHYDNALEAELERLGDIGCWSQEMELERDGKMKVVVKGVPVVGPSN